MGWAVLISIFLNTKQTLLSKKWVVAGLLKKGGLESHSQNFVLYSQTLKNMLDVHTPGGTAANAHPLKRSRPGKLQKTMLCCLCPSDHFGLPDFSCTSCAEPNHPAWNKMWPAWWKKLLDVKGHFKPTRRYHWEEKRKPSQLQLNFIFFFIPYVKTLNRCWKAK